MKIEDVKKYSDDIKAKISELNEIMLEAAADKIDVEIVVTDVCGFGYPSNFPTIEVKIKINPDFLEE